MGSDVIGCDGGRRDVARPAEMERNGAWRDGMRDGVGLRCTFGTVGQPSFGVDRSREFRWAKLASGSKSLSAQMFCARIPGVVSSS